MLSDILGVDVPPDFFASCYGNKPCLMRPLAGRRPPFGWTELNCVLQSHKLPPPRIRIASPEGEDAANQRLHSWAATRSPGGSPLLRRSALHAGLQNGGTLVIDGVNELSRELRDLTIALSGALDDAVGMNCYASFGSEKNFGPHWDEHDVFAFQVEGEKHWTLLLDERQATTTDFFRATDDPPTDIFSEVLLEQGAVLYVPRGFWHDVVGTGGPSLHLSIGVARRRAIDVLRRMVDQCEDDPVWAAAVPRFVGLERRARFDEEVRAALATLAARPIAIDDFLSEAAAHSPLPLATNLPWAIAPSEQVDDEVEVTWLGKRARVARGPDHAETLLVAGQELELTETVRVLIDLIAVAPRHVRDILKLTPEIESAEVRRIVKALARRGLVELVRRPVSS